MSEPVSDDPAPGASVILPVRNEEKHLRAAAAQVLAQEYPGPYEVLLAVGPSHDHTLEIAEELAAQDERVTVIDNPSGRTSAALNRAVAAAKYDILVRVDGHSEIRPDYVANAVRVSTSTGAANVGGMMVPVGKTPFEQAVARAMSSPLGIGSEKFHTGGGAGPAPTVYLGVFRREALERVGGFDEGFVRAQDWELNYRLRQAGETVWFDPVLAVTYRPRGSWRTLGQQFFRTGQWRRQVVRTYPETANIRYLAPPLALVGVAGGVTLAAIGATTGPRLLTVAAIAPATYAALVAGGSLLVGRGMAWRARACLAPVIATMHLTWGLGFLRGVGAVSARAGGRPDYPGSAHMTGAAHQPAVLMASNRPTAED